MAHSKVFHLPHWVTTAKGTPVELFASKSLQQLTDTPSILLIGGVHGDEPEGVWLAKSLLNKLMQISHKLTKDWVLIPCLNPDGFKSNLRTNANGVDLNRNFPTKNWSSEYEQKRYYPGKSPISEKETIGVVDLVSSQSFSLIIHFHSWNPCIVYTADKPPWEAEILAKETGYELKSTIGYDAPGSLGDWGWEEKNTPVICVEEKEKTDQDDVWPRFETSFLEIFATKERFK